MILLKCHFLKTYSGKAVIVDDIFEGKIRKNFVLRSLSSHLFLLGFRIPWNICPEYLLADIIEIKPIAASTKTTQHEIRVMVAEDGV